MAAAAGWCPCLRRSLTAPEDGSRARACECQPRRVCRGTVWALAAGPQRVSSSPRRRPPWLWLLADVAGSPGAPKCPAVRSSELALPKPAALSGGTSGCPARTLLWMHRKWLRLLGVCLAWLPGRGQGRTCLEDPASLFAMVHLPRATAAQPASPLSLQARCTRHLFVFQVLTFKRAKHRPAPVRSCSRQVASRLYVTRWPAHETSSLAENADTPRVVFRLVQGGGSELCFPRFPLKINYLVVCPYAGCRSGQQPARPPVLLTATSLSWAPLHSFPRPRLSLPSVAAVCHRRLNATCGRARTGGGEPEGLLVLWPSVGGGVTRLSPQRRSPPTDGPSSATCPLPRGCIGLTDSVSRARKEMAIP